MPQVAIGTALFTGTPEAPEITPCGSPDADPGTIAPTFEGENPQPYLAIIRNGI